MAERKNDITLTPDQLKFLADEVEDVFREYNVTEERFTKTKELHIYNTLQQEILATTGIRIGNATLRDIMTKTHPGRFRPAVLDALKRYIKAFQIALNAPESAGCQKIFWGTNQGMEPGAFVEEITGNFIHWPELKKDIEEKIISQCPRIIPPGSFIQMESFYGKPNWIIQIYSPEKKIIGSVWIGGNPAKNWVQDGLIRIGKTVSDTEWVVYQVLGRFPDGSYRLIKSFV